MTAPDGRGRSWPPVPGRALLLALTLGLLLAALAPLGHLVTGGGITAMDLMSDPVELTGTPWYLGGVAALNLFLWAAAAGLLVVAGVGLWPGERRLAVAMLVLGLVAVVVALDDRFLLHELVLPHFGVPEVVSYAAYAAGALVLTAALGRVLLREPAAWLLVLALAGLAASVALDLTGIDSTVRRVAEETAKMVGASALAFFPGTVLVGRLRQVRGAARDAPRHTDHHGRSL